MYIKKIVIQGFKTYKNTTVIDLLSPKHNVVVGRNGSGKSNFFAAIRFVLSDAYTHMTREERQGLIHEGSGTVMSAYVEIIFDNSDGRFPINKEEISIRRTIGMKKDDYSLDGRSATRSDIMNLLESAGFSRSNPYYIVPQGRITALTNSKDSERLTLLKEVSGATVFESKLKESMKEMNNSNYKKQRIDQTLQSIDERLSDLEVESADLQKFQSLEKSKKILEFNLFDRELNDLHEQLDLVDQAYGEILSESQKNLGELEKREKLCQQLTETINDLKTSLKISRLENEETDLEYNRLFKAISEKEIRVNELKSMIENYKEKSSNLDSSIQYYKSLIKQQEDEIAIRKPELLDLQKQEEITKTKLSELISAQRSLYAKLSRFLKFKSKKERDAWLRKECVSIKSQIKLKESLKTHLEQEIAEKNLEISSANVRFKMLEDSINNEEKQNTLKELQGSVRNLRKECAELSDKRKSLWRDEIKYRSICDSVQRDVTEAEYSVNRTMNRSQSRGLEAVKQVAAKLNLQEKVYGPLVELFNVSDKYKTAVEVVAGNSLFHVVVDNDKTAALIMNDLARTKAGRVTFMPINRLSPPEVEYPDGTQHLCIPLIKKLKFDDEKVGAAMNQVFGKTIVCNDLQNGSELARMFKLNAITLDGDRADTKGVLSGGYRDYRSSRIDAIKLQIKKKKEFTNVQKDLDECSKQIEEVNVRLNACNTELQNKVRSLEDLLSSQEPIKSEIAQLKSKIFNLEQESNSLRTNLTAVDSIVLKFKRSLKEHESEMKSGFGQSLTQEEIQTLQDLNRKIQVLEGDLDKVVTRLSDVETGVSTYESELSNNYGPHLRKLYTEKASSSTILSEEELKELEGELGIFQNQMNDAKLRNQSALNEFKRLEKEISISEDTLKNANEQQLQIIRKIEKYSKDSEKTLNKKAILASRRDELQKSIRELGVLPEQAFQQSIYAEITSDQLLSQLNGINDELLKYAHINKKALEQYNTFTRQRDDLVERKAELERSKESIEHLIERLETQKDEAITKSFKQVAKSFHEVFEALVPQGVGHLIMQKKSDSDNEVRQLDASQNEQRIMENYTGVSISVSFNSKNDEQQRIEQLSGGQKSLCAIALILAIQKCDPAPFYLFDEIDANLDTQYRSAVASIINSLASSAQFICTTFRPEMLQVADKFYGVMFSNKVSTVSEINRDEAMTFIEGQQRR
ncbi:uncharacterized protein PRCAT00005663001 [Priceomyces carsonii]|uniref:uncharacterized protein n=1 Tax=Priceomyces carsonii TaxID=28549 RepID=UPI002EDAAE13|nr:unnamed protein product [Priceomyces carsonii]